MSTDFDPATSNVFVAAVQWISQVMMGTIAIAAAVLAVASIGLLLMTGRIDVRRAAQVIVGCFILFGASSIASGIMRVLTDSGAREASATAAPPPPPLYVTAPSKQAQPAVPHDPYAGAAVPTR